LVSGIIEEIVDVSVPCTSEKLVSKYYSIQNSGAVFALLNLPNGWC
jgi:hypothetical protein